MKRIKRRGLVLLLAPVLISATLSSGIYTIDSCAETGNTIDAATEMDKNDVTTDDGTADDVNAADVATDAASDQFSGSYDVCFYIRGNCVGSEIPPEPLYHFGETYSSAIRVNNAVSYDNLVLSEHEVDGSDDSLLSDNFTASNSVSEMLSAMPDAEAIRSVLPEFDENKHYVVWYVMKAAMSSYPNSDVYLHVDGVIRERSSSTSDSDSEEENTETPIDEPKDVPADYPTDELKDAPKETPKDEPKDAPKGAPKDEPKDAPKADQTDEPKDAPKIAPADEPKDDSKTSEEDTLSPEDTFTPKEIEELEKLGSEIEIEIEALYLDEEGNEVKEIPYDGQEHLIGGFAINVKDKAAHSLIDQLKYNYKGELISYAADDCTFFNVRDRVFSINITGAYVMAKEVGAAVISFYSGSRKLTGPEEFAISDEKGRSITSYLNVVSKSADIKVTARELTIEAGTTVKNDDGMTLTNDDYKITSGSLMDGHKVDHVVFNGSQTGAGECANQITSVTIIDENGKDVTALYNIKTVDGKLILVDASQSATPKGNVIYKIIPSNTETDQTIKVIEESGSAAYAKAGYDQGTVAPTDNSPIALGKRSFSEATGVITEVVNTSDISGDILGTDNISETSDIVIGTENVSESSGGVLGARKSATEDDIPTQSRITVIFAFAVLLLTQLSYKKSKLI